MLEANRKSPRCFFNRARQGCAAIACLVLFRTFLGCHLTPEVAVDNATEGRRPRPIDADPQRAEIIGREALAKIGYIPIINLARQAGWVTRKEIRSTPGIDRSLISMDIAQATTASEFIDVFSKYAFAAGVASQADSPLPGPGDAVAIGIVVIGLIDAGLLAGAIINAFADESTTATGSTTSSPPVTKPNEEPKPEDDPKKTDRPPPPPPPPPPPDCPRNESFAPKRTDNATGCIAKNGHLRCYAGKHFPCAGVHTHGTLNYQEIRKGVCKAIGKPAVRCEGPFIISGPCGSVPTVDCGEGGPETCGIYLQ